MRFLVLGYLSMVTVVLAGELSTTGQPGPQTDGSIVRATVGSTLGSAGEHIRQLAFDGDAATFFASATQTAAADHFTLALDRPVVINRIQVSTGRPDGSDRLDAGTLETSADGKSFQAVARFANGMATASLSGAAAAAVRIKPAAEANHPLLIREITIDSNPPVAVFKYPVEITVDATDAPELKEWSEQTAMTCERVYPIINEELKSDGFTPPRRISMALKKSERGVAGTSDDHIVGSVAYFDRHRDDVGAMVHEMVHVVQHYRRGHQPGWLVEGISDYVRFFKFEPGKLGPINTARARYDRGYRVSAAFLAFLTDKYDKALVRKVNAALREGRYKDELFKELTGKTLQELDAEWRTSLPR